MRIFELARRPTRLVRVSLAAVALALGLALTAHSAHSHQKDSLSGNYTLVCGYCVAFDGVIDGPINFAPVSGCASGSSPQAVLDSVNHNRSVDTSAQPRAPPAQ